MPTSEAPITALPFTADGWSGRRERTQIRKIDPIRKFTGIPKRTSESPAFDRRLKEGISISGCLLTLSSDSQESHREPRWVRLKTKRPAASGPLPRDVRDGEIDLSGQIRASLLVGASWGDGDR
jgi:hypothetical protein